MNHCQCDIQGMMGCAAIQGWLAGFANNDLCLCYFVDNHLLQATCFHSTNYALIIFVQSSTDRIMLVQSLHVMTMEIIRRKVE